MFDIHRLKERYAVWVVEAKGWVQDLKETGEEPPVGGAGQGLSPGEKCSGQYL